MALKWAKDAEEAVSKVPFFIRRKVRKRVEEEAVREGAREVGLNHVLACKQRFLRNMDREVRGYRLEACFGKDGCPNRAVEDDGTLDRLETLLAQKNLRDFLVSRIQGPLKFHHEFRVSVSYCPNACSRPQITDVGLMGARLPALSCEPCTGCGSCIEQCREEAVAIPADSRTPTLDFPRCLACGQCIAACPTGRLQPGKIGYRILLGGKLGRHPQLGRELPGVFTAEETLEIVRECLDHFIRHNEGGERFGEVLNRVDLPGEIWEKYGHRTSEPCRE
ncbi:MAG TPA: 4Fe-4S dicluster domain-containing protein [Syntrophobacteraceae bacterium]|nr:4Fe-4S dicluster domain-containing protein [Syntrophobacteraceae bacterium]